jgi:hypothetical protein
MHMHRGAFSGGSGRLWRSLIGLLVAYAIAIQGFVLGFSGPLAAAAHGLPAFELCLNGTPATPGIPANDHAPAGHCLLCAAGWQPVLDAPPACALIPVNLGMGRAPLALHDRQTLPFIARLIAQPRAPPAVA